MSIQLSLHPTISIRDGLAANTGTPMQYEVLGYPGPDIDRVLIGQRPHTDRWQIRERYGDGWTGDFDSPEAALAALQARLP